MPFIFAALLPKVVPNKLPMGISKKKEGKGKGSRGGGVDGKIVEGGRGEEGMGGGYAVMGWDEGGWSGGGSWRGRLRADAPIRRARPAKTLHRHRARVVDRGAHRHREKKHDLEAAKAEAGVVWCNWVWSCMVVRKVGSCSGLGMFMSCSLRRFEFIFCWFVGVGGSALAQAAELISGRYRIGGDEAGGGEEGVGGSGGWLWGCGVRG